MRASQIPILFVLLALSLANVISSSNAGPARMFAQKNGNLNLKPEHTSGSKSSTAVKMLAKPYAAGALKMLGLGGSKPVRPPSQISGSDRATRGSRGSREYPKRNRATRRATRGTIGRQPPPIEDTSPQEYNKMTIKRRNSLNLHDRSHLKKFWKEGHYKNLNPNDPRSLVNYEP